MALYLRGDVWWARFQCDGKCIRKSTRQRNESDARKVHDKIAETISSHKSAREYKFVIGHDAPTLWVTLIETESAKGDGGVVGLLKRRVASRAKRDNLTCLLSKNDVIDILLNCRGVCSVTGSPLSFYGEPWFKPSIDRIDNAKGYTLDNVRIVCAVANFAMNVWGERAIREMCAYYSMKIITQSITLSAID